MTPSPRHSVLHKIAARRTRLGHPRQEHSTAPADWASFLSGSASGSASPSTPPAPLVARGGPGRLTRRELEVLHLVARGETDQRIADRLYLSRRTINCHVANILAKLDVPSRTAAVMTAARIGLL
jgi:DNA-binding NarL/FixJ family response regulator